MKKEILIPSNLNRRFLKLKYPHFSKSDLDYEYLLLLFYIIQDLYLKKKVFNKQPDNPYHFTNIHHTYLRKYIPKKKLKLLKNILIDLEIIKVSSSNYKCNGDLIYSYAYKIFDHTYEKNLRKYKFNQFKIIRKFNQFRHKDIVVSDDPICKQQKQSIDNQIISEKAIPYLQNKYKDNPVKLNERLIHFMEFNRGDSYSIRDDKTGRIFNSLTGLPSDLRKFRLFNGNVVEITSLDMKNALPTILASRLRNNTSPDVQKFVTSALEGRTYEMIQKELFLGNLPRDEIKEFYFKEIQNRSDLPSKKRLMFITIFPNLNKILKKMEDKSDHHLSVNLMRYESKIMVNNLLNSLIKEFPEYADQINTIHDEINFPVELKERVIELFKSYSKKILGVNALYKIEQGTDESLIHKESSEITRNFVSNERSLATHGITQGDGTYKHTPSIPEPVEKSRGINNGNNKKSKFIVPIMNYNIHNNKRLFPP